MHPQVNLTHLKFFCDAVVNESLSESAKINFVSQSAVSQAIAKLESIFGVQLFFQSKLKVLVTEEGKIVYEKAKKIFKSVQDTFDAIHSTKDVPTGECSFITSKSLGSFFIAPRYQMIQQNLPQVTPRFKLGGLNLMRSSLKQEEVEFAIVVYDPKHFGPCEKITLKKGLFQLYQSSKGSQNQIDEGIFVYNLNSLFVSELKEHFEGLKLEYPLIEMTGFELLSHFAELNIGVSFFPDYLVSENRSHLIVKHPLMLPPFEYEIAAIYNKGQMLSKASKALIEELKEA